MMKKTILPKDLNKVILRNQVFNSIFKLHPYEIIPPAEYSINKSGTVYPHKSFEQAWRYIVHACANNNDAVLCHGLCSEQRSPHGWVEISGEIVFDGVLQRFYKKDDYYREYNIEKKHEFTAAQAAELARSHSYENYNFYNLSAEAV